jgi:tetratricopeptide (TPR) repeat protein
VYVSTLDAATGSSIVQEVQVHASSKQDVLAATGKLAEKIRKGLGDAAQESTQQSAAETFTASSLEAAHAYAQGQDLSRAAKFAEAIQAYRQAIELDPGMGRAYAGIASADQNLGRQSDAEASYKLALARIDRMTQREKYRTRAGYYLLIRNNAGAIQELTALVKDYPADTSARANLAYAYFLQRDMDKAIDEEKRAIAITPRSVLQHSNLSQYALYAGDFNTAIKETQQVLKDNPAFETARRTLAVAYVATGHTEEGRAEYTKLQQMSPRGASMALSGLADLALYEGRLSEATNLLEKAIAADFAIKNTDAAANDEVTLAATLAVLNRSPQARASASKATSESQDPSVLYRAAQVFLAVGEQAQALRQVAPLAKRLESEPQVYVKLIEGESQLKRGKPREALVMFQEAQKLLDSWLGHFDLGRAYLDFGAFTEASSEFDVCLRRRGEATSVFFDDNPSYHWLPDVYYYQGRAREALKTPDAADSYRTFLSIKEKGEGDPLVADARKRLGRLTK